MLHLVGLVVLVTLSVDVNGCDMNALGTCVSEATPSDNSGGGGDACGQYTKIMACVSKYNATCTNEVKDYTSNLGPLEGMCGGGGGGGGQQGGCNMQALSGCMSSMESVQGIIGGDAPPTGTDLQRVCDVYSTFQTCLAALPPACAEVLKNNNMQSNQQMVDQYCGNDGCDLIGVQGCMQQDSTLDLNFDGESALSSIVKVSSKCGKLQDVLTCLQPKLEGCKNNEFVKNSTAALDQMKMMLDFVCKEKKQAIMDLAECASKPVALQKLSECEAKHPMSSDPDKESKEKLCTEVNTMSACLKTATSDLCTEKETTTMIDLLRDTMKMFLKGEDPCAVSGAGMLMSSVWTSLAMVVTAMFL